MESKEINGRKLLFVEVPEDVFDFKLARPYKYWQVDFKYQPERGYTCGGFALMYKDFGGRKKYPEKLLLIGLASTLTEDDWHKLVDRFEQPIGWRADENLAKLPISTLYMNYTIEKPVPVTFLCVSALNSGLSLLKSLNKDAKTTLIIEQL